MKRKIAVLLAMFLVITSFTACNSQTNTEGEVEEVLNEDISINNTLVVATGAMNGVFNSFFASNSYDNQVIDMIQAPVCRLNEKGKLIDWLGHVETEEIVVQDGHTQVKYTITLKENLVFSDGEPITIDDLIFTYHVLADPTYDGGSIFSTLDIVGMKEYYYDTENYSEIIKAIENRYSLGKISKQDYISYLVATNIDGWFDGVLPGNIDKKGTTWVDYLEGYGYNTSNAKTADEILRLLAQCEYDNFYDEYDPLSYYKEKAVLGTLEDGIDVATILGIEKVDDLTCTILFDSVNILGEKAVSLQTIMPEHYYGKNWSKGDLSSIKALNGTPLGAGPYKFVSYENNIVTLEANEHYFKGCPRIPNLKIQYVNEEDKLDFIAVGDVDITNPVSSLENIKRLKKEKNVEYNLVDNSGYGYIGINAERIPDINIRKGLMHLMNKVTAIQSSYGELATVIERPMSTFLEEYPKDVEEYYGYSTEKALEYFKMAGYEQIDGKLIKDGEQLKVTVGIGEASNHPCTAILTQMTNDMASLGAELIVNDLQFNVLSTMVRAGELDMWVMALGNSTSCDLTQIFGSKGNSNYYCYNSDEIDAIQKEILQTSDFEKRCELVARELDLIMDAAICMPVYQRKNIEAYNIVNINKDTLPEHTTIYWNYANQIETIEMNE